MMEFIAIFPVASPRIGGAVRERVAVRGDDGSERRFGTEMGSDDTINRQEERGERVRYRLGRRLGVNACVSVCDSDYLSLLDWTIAHTIEYELTAVGRAAEGAECPDVIK